jgi:hypothetical protein
MTVRMMRSFLAALRNPFGYRLAGALQRAVHRLCRGAEQVSDLGSGEREYLAQDQHRPLVGGQMLQRRHVREFDALLAAVHHRRVEISGGDVVRPGLEPDGLGDRSAEVVARRARGPVVPRQHPPRPLAGQAEAAVGSDAVEPGAQ